MRCATVTTIDVSAELRAVINAVRSASASLLVSPVERTSSATQERSLAMGAVDARADRHDRRRLARARRAVPQLGLFVRHVWWLRISYTTTRPTLLGRRVTLPALAGLTALLSVHIFLAWRRGRTGNTADRRRHIRATRRASTTRSPPPRARLDTPYVLDIGQFVVVLAVGTNLMLRLRCTRARAVLSGASSCARSSCAAGTSPRSASCPPSSRTGSNPFHRDLQCRILAQTRHDLGGCGTLLDYPRGGGGAPEARWW